jgi:hypothetical protein
LNWNIRGSLRIYLREKKNKFKEIYFTVEFEHLMVELALLELMKKGMFVERVKMVEEYLDYCSLY